MEEYDDSLPAIDDTDAEAAQADTPQTPERQAQSFVVSEELHGQRADKILALACPQFSRERLQGVFGEGGVLLRGQAIAKKTRLSAGDEISFTPPAPVQTEVRPVPMDLPVLYEDDWLVAFNKPVGLVVHPGAGVLEQATLVHGALHHCGGRLAGAGGAERPGIVHRLDRETSGIIVLAKTDEAYYQLVKAFAERNTRKIYWALVARSPSADDGTSNQPIGRHATARHKMAVREDGRHARTDWKVLERFASGQALLQCHIHTGRTHQIRVHLSDAGFPVWGDTTYGFRAKASDKKIPGQFLLHARELELPHPHTGLPLRLEAEPSAHFAEYLQWLRAHG